MPMDSIGKDGALCRHIADQLKLASFGYGYVEASAAMGMSRAAEMVDCTPLKQNPVL